MNKDRRKAIDQAIKDLIGEADKVIKLRDDLEEIKSNFEAGKDTLISLKDEEQDYHDAMPESFQQGERGSKAEEAVSNLEEADSALDDVITKLDDAIGNLQGAIDTLDGVAEDTQSAESAAESAKEG